MLTSDYVAILLLPSSGRWDYRYICVSHCGRLLFTFWDGIILNWPGWPWALDLYTSASLVAANTGLHHLVGLAAWYVFSLDIMSTQGENICSSSCALVLDLLPRPKALIAVRLLLLARPGSSSLYLFLIVWPKAGVGQSVHVNFLCCLGPHR